MLDSRPSFKINAGIRDVNIHPLAKRAFVNRSFQRTRKVDELLGKRPSGKRQPGDIAPRRFVDFDTLEQELERREGIKVRAGPETKGVMEGITEAINTASTAQLRALADTVGVPITLGVEEMKDLIETFFLELDDGLIQPSLKQQTDILQVLKEIRDRDDSADLDEFLAAEPVEEKLPAIPDTVTAGRFQKWVDAGVDNQKMKIIKDLYVKSGGKVEDSDKKQSLHRFILGPNGKLITVGTVKVNMATGKYVLNVKRFRLEKV